MQILSNCITERVDEGCLKVANSVVKRIKAVAPKTTVISYERRGALTDVYLDLNKLLLSSKLFSLLKKDKQKLLYIPFPAGALPTALRIFILSLFCGKRIDVLLAMRIGFSGLSAFLLKLSGVNLIVLSAAVAEFYGSIIPQKRIKYLKSGVDTKRFSPADKAIKAELCKKYGIDQKRPVVLHIGHLNEGRGVGELLKVSSDYQVLLVTSTLTRSEQDADLRERLLKSPNVKIIDSYIENVEEIYQLSDVYFFPTREMGRCIDVPLSCLEAAACGLPVITTEYGEMRELKGKEDFYFIDEVDEAKINSLISEVLSKDEYASRNSAMEYDFEKSVERILE